MAIRPLEVGGPPLRSRQVLGMRVDATTHDDAVARIISWAEAREARYVYVACVNNVMEARNNTELRRYANEADLVTPDGMPLVWMLRGLGIPDASRVRGFDLTVELLAEAARREVPVGFYGSSPEVLARVQSEALRIWPRLSITYAWSPPFRELTPFEVAEVTRDIRASGARLVFVGLGCPKQEVWMARHHRELGVVLVGVGAAFDFLAGNKKQAALFMQQSGFEWLFRLASEPRRLWKRYLVQNPRFLVLWGVERLRRGGARRRAPVETRPGEHGDQ